MNSGGLTVNLPPNTIPAPLRGMETHVSDAIPPLPATLPQRLAERTAALLGIVAEFLGRDTTPEATFAFEKKLRTSSARPVVR
jgi:hypothetical protein